MHKNWMMVLVAIVAVGAMDCKKKTEESAQPAANAPVEPTGPTTPTEPAKAVEPVKEPTEPATPTQEPTEPAQVEGPGALLDKAIEAVGGLENLKTKTAAATMETEGKFFGQPYKAINYFKAPGTSVMVIAEMEMSMGRSADSCWSTMGEIVVDCSKTEKEESDEMAASMAAMMLYPLKGEGVTLEDAGESDLNGTAAVGVKASGGFLKMPVTLYFDKTSNALLRIAYEGHFMGQVGPVEINYSNVKDFDGLKLPANSTMTLGGKVLIEETIVSVKWGEVDEAKLAKPAQVAFGETKIKAMPEHLVAVTKVTGPYDKLGEGVKALFGWVMSKNLVPMMAYPTFIFVKGPGDTQNPEEYETLVGLAVFPPAEMPAAEEGFEVKTMPAGEMAWMLQQGPPMEAAGHYEELAKWIEENGYAITEGQAAAMMMLGNPEETPAEQLLEVLFFPVTKKE
ncbi:MAG: GyrI-like domain-containing protein [Deltaproteobacteria bacterium]|nr:GyrI-like domain-containing protein [Deltaproteobacteria bacterium]